MQAHPVAIDEDLSDDDTQDYCFVCAEDAWSDVDDATYEEVAHGTPFENQDFDAIARHLDEAADRPHSDGLSVGLSDGMREVACAAMQTLIAARPPLPPAKLPLVAYVSRDFMVDFPRMDILVGEHPCRDLSREDMLSRLDNLCAGDVPQLQRLTQLANQSMLAMIMRAVPERTNAWPVRWRGVCVELGLRQGNGHSRIEMQLQRGGEPGAVQLTMVFTTRVLDVRNLHPELGYLPSTPQSWAQWSISVELAASTGLQAGAARVLAVDFDGDITLEAGGRWQGNPPDPVGDNPLL